jgi:hypothetical protein
MLVDPKSVKKIDKLTVFFMLLESVQVKGVHGTLMKWSPGVNFINIFCARLLYEIFAAKILNPNASF